MRKIATLIVLLIFTKSFSQNISSGAYTISPTVNGKPHFVGGKISIGSSVIQNKVYVEDNTTNKFETPDPRVFGIYKNNDPVGYVTHEYRSGTTAGKLEIGYASSGYGNAIYANRGTIISRYSSGLILRSTADPNFIYDGITFQTGSNIGNTPERMRIDGLGNVGIGTQSPNYKLHLENGSMQVANGNVRVQNGDVFVTDATKGIILKSPNGNCWRVTIDDNGDFIKNAVACPTN